MNGDEVAVDLLLDAPFVEVATPRASGRCRAEDGEVRHRTELSVAEAGEYQMRIALLSAGRLVQALPVVLVAEEPKPALEAQ